MIILTLSAQLKRARIIGKCTIVLPPNRLSLETLKIHTVPEIMRLAARRPQSLK